MPFEVEYTDEFGDWWDTLSEHEQDKVAAFFTLYLWSFLSISRASLDGNR